MRVGRAAIDPPYTFVPRDRARSLTVASQGGDYLPTYLVVHLVPFGLGLAADDEPVHAGVSVEAVDGVVVVDRGRGEAVRAVQTAAQRALEVLDAGVVIGVGSAPLLHDSQE